MDMSKSKNRTRKLVGVCAVDSGQIMLTDPCYVKYFVDGEEYAPTVSEETHPYSYNGACGASLSEAGGGQLRFGLGHAGAGVCVSTGIGDGLFPVYLEYDEEYGELMSVTIQFQSEEDWEDEDEDEGNEDED